MDFALQTAWAIYIMSLGWNGREREHAWEVEARWREGGGRGCGNARLHELAGVELLCGNPDVGRGLSYKKIMVQVSQLTSHRLLRISHPGSPTRVFQRTPVGVGLSLQLYRAVLMKIGAIFPVNLNGGG